MNRQTNVAVLLLLTLLGNAQGESLEARMCVSRADVQEFLGTTNAKLVFVNDPSDGSLSNTLHFVDFAETGVDTPLLRTIALPSGQSPEVPMLSPDGQWVAYATFAGSTHVCPLEEQVDPTLVKAGNAYEPRFLQNADEMTLLYGDSGGDYRCSASSSGRTLSMAIPNGIPSGDEHVVWGGGAFTGGLSWEARYLVRSCPELRLADLLNPSANPLRMHELTYLDTATGLEEQWYTTIAFASISSSRLVTNAAMYLDCGSLEIGCYVSGINHDRPWHLREVLFVSRGKDQVLRHLTCPDAASGALDTSTTYRSGSLGEERCNLRNTMWANPEWSNHPYFACAGLVGERIYSDADCYTTSAKPSAPQSYCWSGNTEALYIVDLRSSSCLKVVQSTNTEYGSPTNLLWPCLWVQVPEEFEEAPYWLDAEAATVPKQAEQAAPYPFIACAGGDIRSSVPLQGLEIYTVAGRRVWAARGLQSRTVRIPPERMTAAAYVARVHFADGGSREIRWSSVEPR